MSRLLPSPVPALLATLALAAVLLLLLSPDSIQAKDEEEKTEITDGPIIISAPESGDTYGRRETISIAVTFSRPVAVSGEPRLQLLIGERKRWARYDRSDQEGARLIFAYVVKSKDFDDDGISIAKNALDLDGEPITDARGDRARVRHQPLPDQAAHKVAGQPAGEPAPASATTTPAHGPPTTTPTGDPATTTPTGDPATTTPAHGPATTTPAAEPATTTPAGEPAPEPTPAPAATTPANHAPQFADETTARYVPENTPAGGNVGDPVTAADDDGDTLTYALAGLDAGSFDFDPAAGQIRVKDALDYENRAGYSLTVTVHDGKNAAGEADTAIDDSIEVTVGVNNVDEAGVVSLIAEADTPQVGSLLRAILLDRDGGVTGLTWAWERSANGAAWQTIGGVGEADYTPADDDAGSHLRAVASYSDGHGPGKSAQAVTANPVGLAPQPVVPDTRQLQGAPSVTLALLPAVITEDGGVSAVTATLDEAAGVDVTVTVSASATSPATSSDFTLSANTTLTIAAGATSSAGVVTITAVDNSAFAANKSVTVSGAVSAATVNAPSPVTLTIAEDDYDCSGSTATPSGSSAGLVADCEALLASRDVLRGTAALDWSTSTAIDYWEGVSVFDGRALELNLPGKSLGGSISPRLGDLSNLEILNLSDNSLTGPIPPELENITGLVELWLGDNRLTGSIPPELGNLSDLEGLDLTGNSLTGTVALVLRPDAVAENGGPRDIEVAAILDEGTAWANSFHYAYSVFGQFETRPASSIVNLTVTGSGSSDDVVDFKPVRDFGVTVHRGEEAGRGAFTLEPIPDEVDEYTEEVTVSLVSGTGAIGVADVALSLADVSPTFTITDDFRPTATLVLSRAKIDESGANNSAAVTATLDQVSPTLTIIDVSAGHWFGADENDFTLSANRTLTIPANATSSTDAVTITAVDDEVLSANRTVRVWGSVFRGDFFAPRDVTLTILEDGVDCAGTTAVGANPSAGLIEDCRILLASRETLEGVWETLNWSVSTAIASWTGIGVTDGRVKVLDLSSEAEYPGDRVGSTGSILPPSLGGFIPPQLGSLSALTKLDLSGHSLGQEIPGELGSLSNLTALDLSGNNLIGEIPPELGSLSNLTSLDLSDNGLTGRIPPEVARLSSLTALGLHFNDFTGGVALEMWPTRVAEDGGPREVTVIATLDPGTAWANSFGSRFNFTLSVTGSGSDKDVVDFTEVPDFDISFPAGSSAARAFFTITPEADAQDEADETVTLSASGADGIASVGFMALEVKGAPTLTLTDDHYPTLTLALTPAFVTEAGGKALVTATLDEAVTTDTIITVRTAPVWPAQAADYSLSANATLTIPANTTTSTGTVTITAVDDKLLTANKMVGVWGAVSATTVNGPSPVTLTIAEDDYDCEYSAAAPPGPGGSSPGLVADCEALLASRDVLRGTATLNWSADLAMGSWDGITVDEGPLTWTFYPGQVVEISLHGKSLDGSIPPQLGNVSHLTRLQLSGNRLSGFIPKELGSLPHLTRLRLSGNRLSGSIPKELGNLTELWLGGNELSGSIPKELGNLSNLMELHLDDNKLSGSIPKELGNLSNLKRLWLHENELSGSIPKELGNLSNLTSLWLHENELSGSIPKELGNLSNLTSLWLWRNELSGSIPKELGSLSNLEDLNLPHNRLSGAIPKELGNLSNLETLNLLHNRLSGAIPKELGNLSNLMYLGLEHNRLSGAIPKELGRLSNLKWLYLQVNTLSGAIPKELGSLSSLTRLNLASNQLSGSIPRELGNLSSLTYLALDVNELSGSIPKELGNLSNLTFLGLNGNELSGSIPKELGNLSNLTSLWLHENELSGSIPKELGNLLSLTYLTLNGNELTDLIPPQLANLTNLGYVDLRGNRLTGEVTLELSHTDPVLEDDEPKPNTFKATLDPGTAWANGFASSGSTLTVSVDGSGRAGVVSFVQRPYPLTTIPQGQSSATGTIILSPISDEVGEADETVTVSLASGTGAIGVADVALSAAMPLPTIILLDDDDCSGTTATPAGSSAGLVADCNALLAAKGALRGAATLNWSRDAAIGGWDGVTVRDGRVAGLHLANKGLTGTIPSDLGDLTALVHLDLSYNALTGSLPAALSKLGNLELLHLQNNNLTGTIPSALGDLSALINLDLSYNALTGSLPAALSKLGNLELLRLQNNNLTGTIPAELGDLSALINLDLSYNALTGSLPAALSRLSNLELLRLQNNNLTGTIPGELGDLSALVELDLSGNALTGSLPAALSRLGNLELLHLQNNNLTGTILAELGDLSALVDLDLSDNALTGSLPAALAKLSNLELLHLQNNNLTGTIPAELGDLSALINLDLSDNALTGSLPAALSKLGNLELLHLQNNELTGPIPAEYAALDMSHLHHLDLTGNDLTGTVTLTLTPHAGVPAHSIFEGGGTQTVTVTARLDPGSAWAHKRGFMSSLTVTVAGSGGTGVVGFTPVLDFDFDIDTILGFQGEASADFDLAPVVDSGTQASETITVSATGTGAVNIADVKLTSNSPTLTLIDGTPANANPRFGDAEFETIEVPRNVARATSETVWITREIEVTREVAENSPAGTAIGEPVAAVDPDGDTLTYTLSTGEHSRGRDHAALFDIDANTGQLRVKEPLDYEASNFGTGDVHYTLIVSVSDGKDSAGNTDTVIDDMIAVTIRVTDVDEPGGAGG